MKKGTKGMLIAAGVFAVAGIGLCVSIDKNSFFYPGATLSWIFTKVIPENKVLTFGKARVAYAQRAPSR